MMQDNILKKLISILLIITLTSADFLLIGMTSVTYAVEQFTQDKVTSHKNIEFMAYFKDVEKEVSEYAVKANATDATIYLQIAVKQEGYFDGNITLESGNFQFKTSSKHERIHKITENTIELNRITAGETVEIPVGITLLTGTEIEVSALTMQSELKLEGTYTYGKKPDMKSVTGTRTVTLQMVSPYNEENKGAQLSQTVLTNKVFQTETEQNRVIQMQVEAGMKENLYPIKTTKIELQAPTREGKYPENVTVQAIEQLATNGEAFQDDDYQYDSETGKVTIIAKNEEKDGKITWNKTGTDKYMVTYTFPGTEAIEEQTCIANAEITLYDQDQTTTSVDQTTTLSAEEVDSAVTVSIRNNETEIYKGAMYEGIEREMVQNMDIQVNLAGVIDNITVQEDNQNNHVTNLQNRKIAINLAQLIEILGSEGAITIKNQTTGATIAHISGRTESTDENQNVVMQLPAGVGAITIETTKPIKAGKLTIATTKVIPAQDRQQMQGISEIGFMAHTTYQMGDVQNTVSDAITTIPLKETQTTASMQISKTEFSTMRTNENVEIQITLHSNEEKYELYKNPHISLTVPSEFEMMDVTSVNLLNEDEMTIQNVEQNGNTLNIQLQGEQTKYKEKAIEGATLLITANLTTNKKQKSATVPFILQYENEKAMHYAEGMAYGTQTIDTQIVSYAGFITTNAMTEYGVETINQEGNATAKLQLAAETKTATVSAQVINNNQMEIAGISILGTYPTEGAMEGNNIAMAVSNIQVTGIDSTRVKVYYSENKNSTQDINNPENAWEENITNPTKVKKYLMTIDRLGETEEINFAYQVQVPENLLYNMQAMQNYDIIYTTNGLAEQVVEAHPLTLETGIGPEITTTLTANVGGKDAQIAKEGEKIQYTVTAKNTGSEAVKDLKLTGAVPEGTIYMEELPLSTEMGGEGKQDSFKEDAEKQQVTWEGIELAPREEIAKTYMVKVEKGAIKTTVTNTAKAQYGEAKKESNTVETKTEAGQIELDIATGVFTYDTMEAGDICRYIVNIENTANKNLKNVKLTLSTENATIQEISYLKGEDLEILENTDNVTIPQIEEAKSVEVYVTAQINQFAETENKQAVIQPIATIDKEEYQANRKTITVNPVYVEISNASQNTNQYVKAGDSITYQIDITNKGKNDLKAVVVKDKISAQEQMTAIEADGTELTSEQYTAQKEVEEGGTVIEIDTAIAGGQTKTYFVKTQVDPVLDNSQAIEIDNNAQITAEGTSLGEAMVTHIVEPTSVKIEGDVAIGEAQEEEEEVPTVNGQEEEDETQQEGEPTKPSEQTNNENAENTENTNQKNPSNESTQNENTQNTDAQQPNTPTENKPTQNTPSNATQPTKQTKIISGVAWLDKNENGQKDSDEPLLEGIKVDLFNVETNQIQTQTTTNEKGLYTFTDVPQGEYMVVFEIDNSKYALTTYQKQGVSSEKNSKVISKEMEINGEQKTVAVTEAINVEDEHISYMNMGIKERKSYDMKLEKMITRVVVQNTKGTETTQFKDATLAKVEIDSKLLNTSNVVVEYKIRVTNEGETEGYVRKIADYVSADYKFSSELNPDWYQSGNSIYNSRYANEVLKPGESKEVTLILTKQMTENNTGLITNTAEIVESYNEQGLKDMDSTEANRAKGEDDMASADLIISIKTGQVVGAISVIMITIAILGIGTWMILRKVMHASGI